MQTLQSGLPSRNPGLPSAAQQQAGGGIGARFGGGNLPGTLQQVHVEVVLSTRMYGEVVFTV
jgi:hypothetical protein